MPLAPAYTWSETEASVRIEVANVPIKDQSQLFCSDRVVKLNAPPYLLLLDLAGPVDDDQSVATVHHGHKIVFQLTKAEPGLWGSLVAKGDRQLIKQQRDASVQRAHKKQLAAAQERLARRQQQDKAAVDLQIAEERAQRSRIEALKQQELGQQRRELQDWQQQLPAATGPQQPRQQQLPVCDGDSSDYSEDEGGSMTPAAAPAAAASDSAPDSNISSAGLMPDHDDYHGRGWSSSRTRRASDTAAAAADDLSSDGGSGTAGELAAEPADGQPIIVSAGSGQETSSCWSVDAAATSSIDSSSRLLLTGSQAEQDSCCDIWPTSSRSTAAGATDATPGTAAPSSSSSSSAAPARPAAPVRVRAAPVAVSFTQLETAHLPAREQREVEIRAIKRNSQSDSLDVADRQPAFLKDKGDALAAQGNYRGAINAYSRALELDPRQPALWSNRSACHLALGDAQACVDDCGSALQLVRQLREQLRAAGGDGGAREISAGLLPAAAAAATADAAAAVRQPAAALDGVAQAASPSWDASPAATRHSSDNSSSDKAGTGDQTTGGSSSSSSDNDPPSAGTAPAEAGVTDAKLQQMVVKLLAWRAAALAQLGQLQQAEQDLTEALRLDPGNPRLQADALELQAMLQPAPAGDLAAIKQRGDARFRAGDTAGSVEAYSLLIQLVQQQQQQQQQQQEQEGGEEEEQGRQLDRQAAAAPPRQHEDQPQEQQAWLEPGRALLLSALSNRAACWLVLQDYRRCVADCHQALGCMLGCGGATQQAAGVGPETAKQQAETAVVEEDDCDGGLLQLLLQHPPEQLPPEAARAVARLASRAAVALGCLKRVRGASRLFDAAQQCWLALGEMRRAAELAADRERLLLPQ